MAEKRKLLVFKPDLSPHPSSQDWPRYYDNTMEFLTCSASCAPEGLVVFIEGASLKERDAALAFCASLLSHPATSGIPLVCVLAEQHRRLLEELGRLGVEQVAFRPKNAPLPVGPGLYCMGQNLAEVLERTCPYLNHRAMDQCKEMVHCSAYRNRLIIGRERRTEVCETESHRACPYFLAPKRAASQA